MEKQKKYTDIIDKQIKVLEGIQEDTFSDTDKIEIAKTILDLSLVASNL